MTSSGNSLLSQKNLDIITYKIKNEDFPGIYAFLLQFRKKPSITIHSQKTLREGLLTEDFEFDSASKR